jgi:hypothetical protein
MEDKKYLPNIPVAHVLVTTLIAKMRLSDSFVEVLGADHSEPPPPAAVTAQATTPMQVAINMSEQAANGLTSFSGAI